MPDQGGDQVERLRGAYAAFNRGDFDGAVHAARIAPDFQYLPSRGQPQVRGREGFRAWMEPDAWAELTVAVTDARVVGGAVLVLQHSCGRGTNSGIDIEMDTWAVWSFDELGRTTRLEVFMPDEREDAHRAAGIPEDDWIEAP